MPDANITQHLAMLDREVITPRGRGVIVGFSLPGAPGSVVYALEYQVRFPNGRSRWFRAAVIRNKEQ